MEELKHHPGYEIAVNDGYTQLSEIHQGWNGLSWKELDSLLSSALEEKMREKPFKNWSEEFPYDYCQEDVLIEEDENSALAVFYAPVYECKRPIAETVLIPIDRRFVDNDSNYPRGYDVPRKEDVRIDETNFTHAVKYNIHRSDA